MASKRTLLSTIKFIKYKRDNITMHEAKEIMLPEFFKNTKYKLLANIPDIMAEKTGLKIQFDTSNNMQDTFKSHIKYKIVLRIVVINNAKRYALNP